MTVKDDELVFQRKKLIGGFFNAKTRRGKGKPLPVTYWMASNSTSNTSVLFGGIVGVGLFGP